MENNMIEIMSTGYLTDTIRAAGYKNIENAVSEIIDNSIEANAKEIFIFADTKVKNGKEKLHEIAFLDNGTGMNESILKGALTLGASQKREKRKGIGRYGVGLTNSSMAITSSVEVYSWQNGIENTKMMLLDLKRLSENNQQYLDAPVSKEIPEKYKKYLPSNIYPNFEKKEISFNESGTLVIWTNCDRHTPGKITTLFSNLEKALGRKFRYFIQSDEQSIYLINLKYDDQSRKIIANDPLFLMKNNIYLGAEEHPGLCKPNADKSIFNEPFFEPYISENESNENGEIPLKVKYVDKNNIIKESEVIMKCSIIKEKFYSQQIIPRDPGTTEMGKIAKQLEGISIIRAERELDSGVFDFYSKENTPTHRWWAMELRFEPELDEMFSVTNNKQGVTLSEVDTEDDDDDDKVLPMWLQIKKPVTRMIEMMVKRNKKIRENSKKVDASSAEYIATEAEKNNNIQTITKNMKNEKISKLGLAKAQKVILEEAKNEWVYKNIDDDSSIIERLKNDINIFCPERMLTESFFEVELKAMGCICNINTENIFYKKFYSKLDDSSTEKTTFDLFICAIARTINEATSDNEKLYQIFVEEFNKKLTRYISNQFNGKV
ncbi:MAG: ATP-binding protein [Clostridia bacterium]